MRYEVDLVGFCKGQTYGSLITGEAAMGSQGGRETLGDASPLHQAVRIIFAAIGSIQSVLSAPLTLRERQPKKPFPRRCPGE